MEACQEKWVDIFLTEDNTTSQYKFDDVFCCSVQSVEFDPDNQSNTQIPAYITESNSEWILPTWSEMYGQAAAATSEYMNIQVGDLIRIGGTPSKGRTDYLTVLEKRHVTHVINATNSIVSCGFNSAGNIVTLPKPAEGNTILNHGLTTSGIAHIALRVNASINCTSLDPGTADRSSSEDIHLQDVSTTYSTKATLANRHSAYVYQSKNAEAYTGEASNQYMQATEKFFWPLYRHRTWSNSHSLNVRLDHRVKQCHALKLVGYSLVNKRQAGISHSHEMINDDYLILRIKEVEGEVISNNVFANGSLAILQTGDTTNNVIGATEYSRYEPEGIVCVPVTQNTLKNLSVEIVDRFGKPAHFGRLHMWLKLYVKHG